MVIKSKCPKCRAWITAPDNLRWEKKAYLHRVSCKFKSRRSVEKTAKPALKHLSND